MERKREKIKLAVFDLDGTLLDADDSLQESTIAALRTLYRAGVNVMINSGRAPAMAEAYFYETGIKGICACADGAYITDSDSGLIYQNVIPPDTLAVLVELLIRKSISFSLMTERDIYISETKGKLRNRFRKYEELAKKYDLPFPRFRENPEGLDLGRTPVYKIPIMEAEDGELEGKLKFLKEFSDRIEVTRSGPGIIDITAAGVSKGAAVRFAAERLGIRKQEICCIGDYDNDIDMFREAGIAVAMGNAPKRVKAAADYITKDHNSGGVAEAVERCILPQTEGGIYEN